MITPPKQQRPAVSVTGQSLLEILIIVALVAISVLTLVRGFSSSVGNARLIKERTDAEDYAKEALEWVGLQRDTDWNEFFSRAGGVYCLQDLTGWPAATGVCTASQFVTRAGVNTIYQRELALNWDGAEGEMETVVTVRWPAGNELRLEKSFTNWRQ